MTAREAYEVFLAADNQWHAALTQVFGNRAGDVRYTREGREHPACVAAYQEFKRSGEQWRQAMVSTGR